MADDKNDIPKFVSPPRPVYLDYLVWDWSDKSHPVLKGFKKDTPPEVIEQWKKDRKEYQDAIKKGVVLY